MNEQPWLPDKVYQVEDYADRIRRGYYTETKYNNLRLFLDLLAEDLFEFSGKSYVNGNMKGDIKNFIPTDAKVLLQYYATNPQFVAVGIGEALAILRQCTGYFKDGEFINTYNSLKIQAVPDGTIVDISDGIRKVYTPKYKPVLKIWASIRDIILLKSILKGAMIEASTVATNVFRHLETARGKEFIGFPASFSHYKSQALHYYAFNKGVEAYKKLYDEEVQTFTDVESDWWSKTSTFTIPNDAIVLFLGNSVELMLEIAKKLDPSLKRIARVGFHNNVINEALEIAMAMFKAWWACKKLGDEIGMKKYKLSGIHVSIPKHVRDFSMNSGDEKLDYGVTPKLITELRKALNGASLERDLPYGSDLREIARQYCEEIKIFVSDAFDEERIDWFERTQAPADIYGVGSSLLERSPKTEIQYKADCVAIQIGNTWHNYSKAGCQEYFNADLIDVI